MIISQARKDEIVKVVRDKMDKKYPKYQHHRMCLFWAYETYKILKICGLNALIQAGSASWPMVSKELDDGISSTHFSYKFEDTPFNLKRMAHGHLPEMHVWVGIVETKEIVDLTTKFWPQQAKEIGNHEWKNKLPPDYFWSDKHDDDVQYDVDGLATVFAMSILKGMENEIHNNSR